MVRPGGDAGPTFPEVPMFGSDYPKFRAQHIEAPARRFLCEFASRIGNRSPMISAFRFRSHLSPPRPPSY